MNRIFNSARVVNEWEKPGIHVPKQSFCCLSWTSPINICLLSIFCGTSPLVVIRYRGHSIGYICCVSLQFCLQLFFTVIEMKTKLAQTLDVMGLQILAEYGIRLEVLLIIMSKVWALIILLCQSHIHCPSWMNVKVMHTPVSYTWMWKSNIYLSVTHEQVRYA